MTENEKVCKTLTKSEQRRLKFMELQNKIHFANADTRKRKQRIINNIVQKALKELNNTSSVPEQEYKKNNSIEQKNGENEQKKQLEEEKQRKEKYFLANYQPDKIIDIPEKAELEKQIQEAIKLKDFDMAEYYNRQLSTLIKKAQVQKALDCSEYLEEKRKRFMKKKSKKGPKLAWRFTAKERWEQKGNL